MHYNLKFGLQVLRVEASKVQLAESHVSLLNTIQHEPKQYFCSLLNPAGFVITFF